MTKTAIRFLTPHGSYNAGEDAGFEPAIAERLIGLGVARALLAEAPAVTAIETPQTEPAATASAEAANADGAVQDAAETEATDAEAAKASDAALPKQGK